MKNKAYPLNQSPLYKLKSKKRLFELLGFEGKFLLRLAESDNNFHVFNIIQGEKKRQVEVPKNALRKIHSLLFRFLRDIDKPNYLHSGVRGRSYITNAKAHLGFKPLVKLDIKKFYPSVKFGHVFRFFNDTLLCSPDVSVILARLFTYQRYLPTGSSASQLLGYFAAKPMLDELALLSEASAVEFTCYVDDLTFSGDLAGPKFLWSVKKVIHKHGFSYHKEKYYERLTPKVVTGVYIDGNSIRVIPSRELDMWLLNKKWEVSDCEDPAGLILSVIGKMTAASQIDERFSARVKRLRFLIAKNRPESDK